MEICINSFIELDDSSLSQVDGGTFWGWVSGAATVVVGVAAVVGGIALLGVPEPTTLTKCAGVGGIAVGLATIGAGLATCANN